MKRNFYICIVVPLRVCLNSSESKEKNLYLLIKSYLGRQQERAHHATLLKKESFIYHIPDFAQKLRAAIFL